MAIKKYSKVKFSLRKELVIILVVIAVMIVATILLQQPTKSEKWVSEWTTAGSKKTENKLYEQTSFNKLDSILSKAGNDYVFVYFGTSSDTTSVTNYDIVYDLADTCDVTKVYFIDSKFAMDGDRTTDTEFDDKLSAIETKYSTDTATMSLDYVPNLWVFQNGKLVQEINHDITEEQGNWNYAALQVLSYGKTSE